jgi:hypothetical protein
MSTFIHEKNGLEIECDNEYESQDDVISLNTIIDTEIIRDKLLYSFPLDEEREMKFGIVKINTDVMPILNKVLFFLFTVDSSGSMSDLCNDRRTKNAHIIHTLTNMLRFFSEKENISIYVQVDAFDDMITSIIQLVQISPANVEEMILKLKKIRPRNSTNIELALKNASDQIVLASKTLIGAEKHHIFMTDGDITQGNACEKHLKTLLNPTATNVFIGFGIDHNIKVLSELGGGNDPSSSVNNYYFIDVLENSGLVYGEIIHNILYASLKHVELIVVNGLIYNWKTNAWTNTLNIGNVIFETEKVYHIVSFVDLDRDVEVGTPTIISASGFVENADSPFFYTQYTSNSSVVESIAKYKYRQRTQQLLYSARHFDDYKNEGAMKKKLDDFFNELKDCVEDVDLAINDKPFMKLLMDDVYITRKMFGTTYNSLYSNARQTSQGTQRCYNVGHLSTDSTVVGVNIPRITRHVTHHLTDEDGFGSSVGAGLGAGLGAWTATQPYNQLYEEEYEEKDGLLGTGYEDRDEYEISQHVDTPYSTPALLGIMRQISAPTQQYGFFKDDDFLKTARHTTV